MPLSQKQMEYLALAWQCFETEPKKWFQKSIHSTNNRSPTRDELSQIDYNKFYQIAHLASANSARELMRVTKKKLKEEYGALAATSGDAPGTPRSTNNTPRKAGKASGRNGGVSGSSATGTPSAAGKKRGRKPKGFETGGGGEDVDDEEEEEGSPLKKGKMGGLVEVKREKNSVEEEEEEDEEESILQ
ncbi:hypothetical protein KC333_g3103 [Hortaea werneckii]|nr:hypothetical protein KC333_g3103 [Hortaea werneckii]KAI7318637.1 hypothetical protein KC326_g3526 [Hortaea werneckii]